MIRHPDSNRQYILNLERENDARAKNIQFLDSELFKMSEQNKFLNTELAKQTRRAGSDTRRKNQIQQLESVLQQKQDQIRILNEEVNKQAEIIIGMDQWIVSNQGNNQPIKQVQLVDAHTQNDDSQEEMQNLLEMIETCKAEQLQSTRVIQQLQQRLEEKDHEIHKLQHEETRKIAEIEGFILALNQMEDKLGESMVNSEIMRLSNETLETNNSRFYLDNTQLTKELCQANQKIEMLRKNYKEPPKTQDGLARQLHKHIQELSIIRTHHELKQQEWDRECLDFNAKIARLQKEVSVLKGSGNLKSIAESEEVSVDSLQTSDMPVINRLRDELVELLKANGDLFHQLSQKQSIELTPYKKSQATNDSRISEFKSMSSQMDLSEMSTPRSKNHKVNGASSVSIASRKSATMSEVGKVAKPSLESLQSSITELKEQSVTLRRILSIEID